MGTHPIIPKIREVDSIVAGISGWGGFLGIVTLVSCLFAASVLAHDIVWPEEKLRSLFPQATSFEQKNYFVDDQKAAFIEKALGGKLPEEDLKPSIYIAIVRNAPDGVPAKAAAMLFVDAQGEAGKIEMGVVVSGKGDILKVQLFENKEPEELSRPGFLKQFEGKKVSDPFIVGQDVKAPTGLEKTSQAIASGARRAMLIITEMFKKR